MRWAKKLLRYIPRRSTFQRYRGLKWFADFAFNRSYLWSFKVSEVIPAFYAGWILTFLPVMGLQVTIACILALLLRANVMILVALQMISNPLTIGLLWPFEYKIGVFFLRWLDPENQWALQGTVHEILGKGSFSQKGMIALKVVLAVCVGAVILGYICALISSVIYRYVAKRTVATYEEFVKRKKREAAKQRLLKMKSKK